MTASFLCGETRVLGASRNRGVLLMWAGVANPDQNSDDAAGTPLASDDESRRSDLDDETAQWLSILSASSQARDQALSRLHRMLLRIAHAELRRRQGRTLVAGQELDDLAHQAADDALVAITSKFADFRGDSRFTTWAYRFVIFEVSSKLGRHFWKRPWVSLESDDWDRVPHLLSSGPEDDAERSELVAAVRKAVEEVLTDRQRQVFVAIVVKGIPLDALVSQLGSNRNAVYKTMFDARRKLRAALVAGGYLGATSGGRAVEDTERWP
jgi:RNA polymerase sigma-70 factor (ECF subfamily)